jgi:hypothetical protein
MWIVAYPLGRDEALLSPCNKMNNGFQIGSMYVRINTPVGKVFFEYSLTANTFRR